MVKDKSLTVMTANKQKIISEVACPEVTWIMQVHKFKYGFWVIQLVKYDMILGVDWMKQFSPMIFDFVHTTVEFHYGDSHIILKGGQTPGSTKGNFCKRMGQTGKHEGSVMFLFMEVDPEERTPPI